MPAEIDSAGYAGSRWEKRGLGLAAIRLVSWRARYAEEEAQFRLLERLRAIS